jgi:hypothetical protein
MKRLFLTAGFMAAFLLAAIAVGAQDKPNFAGTWNLDKAKSQGLDQRLQSADVSWVVTQDDKTISIESKVTGGAAPTGGGGGGTGGGRGMGGPRSYNLDGKEVTTEGTGQMGGTNTTKATWNGGTLELMSVRAGSFNGNDFKATTNDKLSLSGDGKVLTVVRHSESPRGTNDSTMVFNKQ